MSCPTLPPPNLMVASIKNIFLLSTAKSNFKGPNLIFNSLATFKVNSSIFFLRVALIFDGTVPPFSII